MCICGDGEQDDVHIFRFKLNASVYLKEPQKPHPEHAVELLLVHEDITIVSLDGGAVNRLFSHVVKPEVSACTRTFSHSGEIKYS